MRTSGQYTFRSSCSIVVTTSRDIGSVTWQSLESSLGQALIVNSKLLFYTDLIFILFVWLPMNKSNFSPLIILRWYVLIGHSSSFKVLNNSSKFESGTSNYIPVKPGTIAGLFHPANLIKSLHWGYTLRVIVSTWLFGEGIHFWEPDVPSVHTLTPN